jgi:hypothetical protein
MRGGGGLSLISKTDLPVTQNTTSLSDFPIFVKTLTGKTVNHFDSVVQIHTYLFSRSPYGSQVLMQSILSNCNFKVKKEFPWISKDLYSDAVSSKIVRYKSRQLISLNNPIFQIVQ